MVRKSYNLLQLMGTGEFSEVYKCIDTSSTNSFGTVSAIKIIDKLKVNNKLRLIKRELEILAKLKHVCRNKNDHHLENVLQLQDYFMTSNHICIITEMCLDIDLYDLITDKKHPVETDQYVFVLLDAIKFLHSNGILHRDIKAENVLLRNMNALNNENDDLMDGSPVLITCHSIVIADFGLATRVSDKDSLTEFVGTLSYIAPEVLLCNPKKLVGKDKKAKPYGFKIDIWSLGVLAYFIAFGYMPFDCETDEETMECIQDASYYLDLNDFTIEETTVANRKIFKDFLEHCFEKTPEKRFSIEELQAHPFIANCESLNEMHNSNLKINKSTASLSSFLFSDPSANTPELIDSIPMVQQVSLNTDHLSTATTSRRSSIASIKSPSTGLYRSKSAELMSSTRSRESLKNMLISSQNNSLMNLPTIHKLHQQKNESKQAAISSSGDNEKVEFYL
ncbi:kinase-like protein [Hanseniaspora valbyensis NRRL Y-1626]|uniref:Kinase-like protein n=1 Tax=Hanseniaspora valbyensis NRRL Y-1626 TaxID=766949 RepID=A0A1B7TGT9_9ASCO|nr:kinase-like protein [Hanseniaspora valbyensis NRRL Y-1626]